MYYLKVDVWGNGCPDAVAPEGTTNIIVCQFTPAQLEYWGYNFTVQTPPTTSSMCYRMRGMNVF